MKKLTPLLFVSALLIIGCENNESTAPIGTAPSDSSVATVKEDAEWIPIDSATEMKAWMEYATPGDMHKKMAKSNGTWNGETTMWMAVGAPPATSKAMMVNKSAMDGRYQVSTFKGNFMGQAFEGMAITGYDNHLKKYVSTWIDNMGTGILKMQGDWDEATKKINYIGKMINPANGKECQMREVYTFVDENNELMEMYGPDAKTGKEYKTMEIKLSRKK